MICKVYTVYICQYSLLKTKQLNSIDLKSTCIFRAMAVFHTLMTNSFENMFVANMCLLPVTSCYHLVQHVRALSASFSINVYTNVVRALSLFTQTMTDLS